LKKKPAKKKPQTRLIDKKPAFLAAFVEAASVTVAAEAAGIDRSLHYQWLDADPEYVKAFEQARRRAAQELEDDAIQWARKGIYEPIVYQGAFSYPQKWNETAERWEDDKSLPPLGVYRRSEGLMIRALKAFAPERYGDRTEVTGANGAPIEASLQVTFVKPKEQQ
jgi:hypothetical protein